MFHAVSLRLERGFAIEPVYRLVIGLVRPAQTGRHDVGIIEIGHAGVWIVGASVKDRLGMWVELAQVVRWGHGKSVVDHSYGIPVAAFQAPPERAKPCHVHCRH